MKLLLAILGILYALSPYDILPDFVPGWGWLDDLVVLFLVWRYVLSPAGAGPDPGRILRGKGPCPRGSPFSGSPFGDRGSYGQDGGSEKSDPYAVLGLSRNASKEEIRRAYRDLAIRHHPDKASHLGTQARELAEARFRELQTAYQELLKKGAKAKE